MNKEDHKLSALSIGIQRERMMRGLSVSQVSNISGVPVDDVNAAECEKIGDLDIVTVARIFQIFGVTFGQLERQAA